MLKLKPIYFDLFRNAINNNFRKCSMLLGLSLLATGWINPSWSEENHDLVIIRIEQALEAWQAQLEERLSLVPARLSATGEYTRAGAQARIRELESYIEETEASIKTTEEAIEIQKQEVTESLEKIMALWQPPPSQSGPLIEPGVDNLYRRILTLPEAKLVNEPGGRVIGDSAIPAFTVMYVYDEKRSAGKSWLSVGRKVSEPEGWIEQDQSEAWRTMLVMQYAPRGQRERVLFLDNRDDLIDMVRSPFLAKDIEDDYQKIAERRHDGTLFTAIEPATAVNVSSRPYLMPVLDWKYEQFDSGDDTTLVQVAGLNLNTESPAVSGSKDQIDQMSEGLGRRQGYLRDFKIGIAFVIDTTASMGPYINQTQDFVIRVSRDLEQRGLINHLGFSLIGYRDNTSVNSNIEYVTRIFQPLDTEGNVIRLIDNVSRMKAAGVSTKDWREDSFAGIDTAINELDWSSFQLKIIILITDAGARSGNDPLAKIADLDAAGMVDIANRKSFVIIPVHLLTNEAIRDGDAVSARLQYTILSQTGDVASDKYLGIQFGSLKAFQKEITALGDSLEQVIINASQGRVQERTFDFEEDHLIDPPSEVTEESSPRFGNILVNEAFRAQLEYLGEIRGTEAPRFYRAWASDRDLVNPRARSLIVNVFLTRNQLNSLAQSLQQLIDAAESAATSAETLFDDLRLLAATTSIDPARDVDDNDREFVLGELLPSFLKALPYRSKVLRLDKQLWLDMGITGQQTFIYELQNKLATYQRINEDRDNWIDLGAGDPALEVFAIDLKHLP